MVQDKELYKNVEEAFYKNGTPQSKTVSEWNGSDFVNTLEKEYYSNGKLKRSIVQDKGLDKQVKETFYDNGKPQSKKIVEWKENANLVKDSKGHYHYESDFVETTNIQYDRNGNVIKKANIQK